MVIMKKNKITFWGVRGSFPTPDHDKMNTGGHTSCVSLENEGEIMACPIRTNAISVDTPSDLVKVIDSINKI